MGAFARTQALATVLVGSALLGVPVFAQDENVQLHGFGGWAFGDTDGNTYLQGTEDGNAENTEFSLAISAEPAESLRVSAQIELFAGRDGELEEELDYAFAEWSPESVTDLLDGDVDDRTTSIQAGMQFSF